MATIIRQFAQKFVPLFLAGVAVFSYLSLAAIAEPNTGSMVLSDLNQTLLNQSAELRQEVKQALKEVREDDVGCVAPIVFRSSTDIHLSRIAPFSCFFGKNKILTIQAQNIVKLPDGKTIPLEQLLKRQNIPQGVYVQFNLTSWKWTN